MRDFVAVVGSKTGERVGFKRLGRVMVGQQDGGRVVVGLIVLGGRIGQRLSPYGRAGRALGVGVADTSAPNAGCSSASVNRSSSTWATMTGRS